MYASKEQSRVRIGIRKLSRRMDKSPQTIWRWYKDPKIAFPRPHYLGQTRSWWLDEVIDWEKWRMATKSAPPAFRDRKTADGIPLLKRKKAGG